MNDGTTTSEKSPKRKRTNGISQKYRRIGNNKNSKVEAAHTKLSRKNEAGPDGIAIEMLAALYDFVIGKIREITN